MKRIISFLFSILLISMFVTPAYAAGGTIHIDETIPVGEEYVADEAIAVQARVAYSSGLPEFPLTNGSGGGKLPDGTEISVTGAPTGATYLVVRKIAQTETEPYKWFREVLGNSEMQAYEIFFRDDAGNRIDANGATIKVSTPDGMTNITVYSVDPDNSKTKLTANVKDGKAIFRTDGSRYYVLTGAKSGTTPTPDPDDPKPTPGGKDDPPKTGDDSKTMLWLIMAVVALVGMIFFIVLWKRRKDKEKENT